MLSPDVPEFIPRGIHAAVADIGSDGLRGVTCLPARDLVYPRQNSNYVHSLSHQQSRSEPNHANDGHSSWRQAFTNSSPRERGETFGRPKFHRYGNAGRGNNNGQALKPEASGDYPTHRANNWRQSWWSNDSSPDKSMNRSKKYNMNFSAENSQPEKNQQKYDIRRGRGGSQVRHNSDQNTENNYRVMVRVEKHPVQIPVTAPSYKGNISYGKILKGNNNDLQESKSETNSVVGLLQDDQWPSLGDARPQPMPQTKGDFQLGDFQNQSNNLSLKKSNSSGKRNLNENAWHVKVIGSTAEKEIEEKDLEREMCKNVLLDTHSNKSNQQEIKSLDKFSEIKVLHRNKNEPDSENKNEQHISAEANILPEKAEYDTGRKDTLDSFANPDDYNRGSDLNPNAGETDPFQWQVKRERKKPTKNKYLNDQADRLTTPVKKANQKDDGKKGHGSKPFNSGPSVRKRVLKEEVEKYGSENVKGSSRLNKYSTNKIYKTKENKESKETVNNLDEAARQVSQEKTGNKDNRGQAPKDGCGAVLSAAGHCDANGISISTENAKDSALQDQKKPLDDHTMQRILELRKRRKEEKMRKKEQKLKKARDLMTSDSKVRVITKDFLEATLAGNNSNKRSAKLSVSHSPGLKLSSEEYPTLSFKSAITPRIISREGSQKISSAERIARIDALTESGRSSAKVDSCLSTQSSGVLQAASSEQGHCESSTDTPSYSGALLAPKKVVNIEVPPQEVRDKGASEVSYTALQKKKVKTKDLIELDIMAAALQSKKNKRRDKIGTEQDTARCVNAKKSTTSDRHISFPSKTARGTTAPSLPTKVKVAAPLKRGKQREGKQKKKISCLKKCMQRARQAEMEALLSILQEAKNAQERSVSSDKQEIRPLPTPLVDSEVTLAGTASSCQETNKELRRMGVAIDIASADVSLTNEHKGDKAGTESAVDSNKEQKHNDLRNMPSESSSNQESGTKGGSVVIGVCQLPQEILDGRSEAETQGVIKENCKVIVAKDSAPAGKQKLDSSPAHIQGLVNMAASSIKTKIIDHSELEKGDPSPEKTEAKKLIPPVQNILGSCSDLERSKKLSIFAEELKALQNPVHKKKFREYCDHVLTADVDRVTQELVESLVRFQERHYQRDPSKARIRRRFVCGLKETTKLMGKMSCIIVAPDIQRSKGPGALDEVVEKMLGQARSHGVPVIFALSCKRLGKLCLKKVPVSCFGIINYQGAQDNFQILMQLVPEARKQYQELVACGSRCVPVDNEEFGSETEPAKLDVREEVIAKTSAIISVTEE